MVVQPDSTASLPGSPAIQRLEWRLRSSFVLSSGRPLEVRPAKPVEVFLYSVDQQLTLYWLSASWSEAVLKSK